MWLYYMEKHETLLKYTKVHDYLFCQIKATKNYQQNPHNDSGTYQTHIIYPLVMGFLIVTSLPAEMMGRPLFMW